MSNNNTNKESFVKNIQTLIELDKGFKTLPQKIKEARKSIDSMLASVKEKRESLLEQQKAREEEERLARIEAEKAPIDEPIEKAETVEVEIPTQKEEAEIKTEAPTIEPEIVAPVIEEKVEAVIEEKPVQQEKIEVKSEENAPIAQQEKANEPKQKEVKKEDKPQQNKANQDKKDRKEKDKAPQQKEKKAEPERDINKYRAQNVVEPRIFIPPTPEKKKPRDQRPNNNNGAPRKDANQGQRPDIRPSANPQRVQPQAGATFVPSHKNDRRGSKQKYDSRNSGYDDKRQGGKRPIVRGDLYGEMDEAQIARRTKKRGGNKSVDEQQTQVITHAIVESDPVPIKTLAEKIGRPTGEIIRKLINNGVFKNINDSIEFSMAELICIDFDVTLELKVEQTNEEKFNELINEEEVDPAQLVKRAPIVTIMGHVDHGKTSLLDYIRSTSVAKGEAGGITQHIGAYTIRLRGEKITFIDTPGHEAFTTMRARGAMVTDIAIIVVAADDSIMPQTIEAINHAKAANVPIIVAINKIDRSGANVERVKNDLLKYDLVCEEYGGDTICVPVSAKTGQGVEELLDQILLLAELYDLKANPKAKARGTILEARLDHNVGAVANVLVQNGTLKVGDCIVAGSVYGKVKSMHDEKNALLKSAGPSIPVAVLGFDGVPNAGDQILVVEEKFAKAIAEERRIKERNERLSKSSSLEDIMRQMSEGKLKELNLIIKCDVQGSVEALSQELLKLCNEEVKVHIVHSGVGAVNESDVTLASTCGAIIIAFNVRPDQNARALSAKSMIEIRCYSVIYEAIEEIQAALNGMLAPKFREVIIGKAEVRNTFKISGVGTIAGCYVTDGKLDRNADVRLFRNNVHVYTGKISSLKRMKDDAKEVLQGFECGLGIEKFNDIKVGDSIECFIMEKCN